MVVRRLLLALTDLHHLLDVAPHVEQQLRAGVHLPLKEAEQRVLDVLHGATHLRHRLQATPSPSQTHVNTTLHTHHSPRKIFKKEKYPLQHGLCRKNGGLKRCLFTNSCMNLSHQNNCFKFGFLLDISMLQSMSEASTVKEMEVRVFTP